MLAKIFTSTEHREFVLIYIGEVCSAKMHVTATMALFALVTLIQQNQTYLRQIAQVR